MPKELNHPRKGLIDIQNIDNNECFEWIIVRHLRLVDRNLKSIKKADKVVKKLDFKDKVSIHSQRIEKKNSIDISVFSYEKHPVVVSKKQCEEKHVSLLLIG